MLHLEGTEQVVAAEVEMLPCLAVLGELLVVTDFPVDHIPAVAPGGPSPALCSRYQKHTIGVAALEFGKTWRVARDAPDVVAVAIGLEGSIHEREKIGRNHDVVFQHYDIFIFRQHLRDTVDDRIGHALVHAGRVGVYRFEALKVVEDGTHLLDGFGFGVVTGLVHKDIEVALGALGAGHQRLEHLACGFVSFIYKQANGRHCGAWS